MEKTAPSTIARPRVQAWLRNNAAVSLRALVAPSGYGKTAAILRHLENVGIPSTYVRAAPAEPAASLAARIAQRAGGHAASFEELRNLLSHGPECTIAIDALDLASIEAMLAVATFAMQSPPHVHVLVAGCSDDTVCTPRMYAQGHAVRAGIELLAFTGDDLAQFCNAVGVAHTPADVRALAALSDGWPVVASAVVRAAMSEERPLHGAYEIWLAGNARIFRRYVEGEVARASENARRAFEAAVAGESLIEAEWQLLESEGLFVLPDDGGYRLLHPVGAVYAQGPRYGHSALPRPLSVAIFGEFEVRYGGMPVKWLRRRDMELVRMLALRPGASAGRAELMEFFWPRSERRMAQQSLRTSCSNVRRAIAAVVGPDRVDRYFRSETEVTLDANAFSLDAHRFASHVAAGDEAYANGRIDGACAHYRAALRLRRGAPAIDAQDPVQREFAARLEAMYARAGARLNETVRDSGARTPGSSDRPPEAPSTRAAS